MASDGPSREYSSFNLGSVTFNCGDTVIVNGEDRSEYIAEIMRIFTTDNQEVCVELKWFYKPEDLPGGRQPFHGAEELLRSDHRDVVSARVVQCLCAVVPMREYEENQAAGRQIEKLGVPLPTYFWRSSYNSKTRKIKDKPKPFCVCRRLYNPDTLMVCCDVCETWYHADCMGVDKKRLQTEEPWYCSKCINTGRVPAETAAKVLKSTRKNAEARALVAAANAKRGRRTGKNYARKAKRKSRKATLRKRK